MKESAVDIPPVGSAMAITLDTPGEGRNADDLSRHHVDTPSASVIQCVRACDTKEKKRK